MRKNFTLFPPFSQAGLLEYSLQLSLIILSILIATGVDRCNQRRNDHQKVHAYLQAILQDLENDQESNELNLVDGENDIVSLERALSLVQYPHDDSLTLFVDQFFTVFLKGVFRTFPPTTFDLMRSSGDLALLKDLDLRNDLAVYFAFRDNIVRSDLQQYDQYIFKTVEGIGQYFDLACLNARDQPLACLTDRDGLLNHPRNELVLLLRQANLRVFHLQIAVQNGEKMLARLKVALQH
ncbi:MAG: hypothetical protein HC821_04240 [Lewinella sp.]|nr:hypothetical protein [Lewinella sp.]